MRVRVRRVKEIAEARRTDRALESAARFVADAIWSFCSRDVLVRESNTPKWRDLLG